MDKDFSLIHIDDSERASLWGALLEQNIIEKDGSLGANNIHQFSFPSCPAYAESVKFFLEKKFAAELVRCQWIKGDSSAQFAINLLPLNPERDLLAALLAVGIISAPRVTDDDSVSLHDPQIEFKDGEEELRKKVAQYLKANRAAYVKNEKRKEASLQPIDVSDGALGNVIMELPILKLAGLDHLIQLGDETWQVKAKRHAVIAAIVAVGLVQISVPVTYQMTAGMVADWLPSSMPGMGTIVLEAVKEICFAIKSAYDGGDNLMTWADYKYRLKGRLGQVLPLVSSLRGKLIELSGKTNVVESKDCQVFISNTVRILEKLLVTDQSSTLADIEEMTRKLSDDFYSISHKTVVPDTVFPSDTLQPANGTANEAKFRNQIIHIRDSVKLMKRTKCPNLFSDIIRDGLPLDHFCLQGLAAVLSNVFLKQQICAIIRIESFSPVFTVETDCQPNDPNWPVIIIRLDDRSERHLTDDNWFFTHLIEKIEETDSSILKGKKGWQKFEAVREIVAKSAELDDGLAAITRRWKLEMESPCY
jgi:hypothetical protein